MEIAEWYKITTNEGEPVTGPIIDIAPGHIIVNHGGRRRAFSFVNIKSLEPANAPTTYPEPHRMPI